jgi:3-hydroxyacyl-CoA dehydrogenase|tara:strand:- start:7005 stop:8072 length:1068 start_codon:yes stop_codon:yes gene_type:complete
MKVNKVTHYQRSKNVALVTVDSSSKNFTFKEVCSAITQDIHTAMRDGSVHTVVVKYTGILSLSGMDDTVPVEYWQDQLTIMRLQNVIEVSRKPIIFALCNSTHGYGLEIALSAHFRICVPSVSFVVPQVKQGLIPGAGTTQRLPRLVSVDNVLEIIAGAKPVSANEALEMGLMDAVVDEGQILEYAYNSIQTFQADNKLLKRTRDQTVVFPYSGSIDASIAHFRNQKSYRLRGFLAQEYAIKVVTEAYKLTFDEGLKLEGMLLSELLDGCQYRALSHVFEAQRHAVKTKDIEDRSVIHEIKKVGVVGAGTMGIGIVQNFLKAGFPVTLIDTNKNSIDLGLDNIKKSYQSSLKKIA